MTVVVGRDLQHVPTSSVPIPTIAKTQLAFLEPEPGVCRPPALSSESSGRSHDRPTENVRDRNATATEGVSRGQLADGNGIRARPDLRQRSAEAGAVRDPEIARTGDFVDIADRPGVDLAIWAMTICRVRPRRGNDRNDPASIRDRNMPVNRQAHRTAAEEKPADIGNCDMIPDTRLRDNAPSPTGDLASHVRRRCYRAIAALLFDFPPRRGLRKHAGPVDPQLRDRRTHTKRAGRASMACSAGLCGQTFGSISGRGCSKCSDEQRP